MDIKNIYKGISTKLQKYKYVGIVVVIGIVLMLLPNLSSEEKKSDVVPETTEQTISLQQELEQILSQISGAGQVRIMLNEQVGEERIYQYNEDITVSDSSTSTKNSIVTVADADRNENGLIKKINSPIYRGAIVLCQGAENPAVKLAVSEAVSKITGLGLDKIIVLKMK